jgi:hypothetical protein
MSQEFVAATKLKLRFESPKYSTLTVEDLWDLSTTSLDTIAKSVNKRLKEEGEESFLSTKPKSKNHTLDVLRLEILKFVIATKEAEAEAAKQRVERAAKRAVLQERLLKIQEGKLESLTEAEVLKELSDLES